MGAWGGLCVFDYSRYTQAVVPAFQSGEQHPLIQATLNLQQREHSRRPGSAFDGLAQLAASCDPLMTSCSLGRVFAVCDGVVSISPVQAQFCGDYWTYEDAADLFERVLTHYTITHYTILGLAFTAVRQLFPAELDLDAATQTLIDQLDNRCQYWAAGTGGYGEGIRGWLDPDETGQLARGLAVFTSSAYTGSGGAARVQPLVEYCNDSDETYTRHMERIVQFLAILQSAQAQGHGALWGRDLQLFYNPGSLFAADEPLPLRR